MQVSLVDMYHTRYFYLTYVKDLTYLFNSCKSLQIDPSLNIHAGSDLMSQVFDCFRRKEPVVFDLANAKLTPDTRSVIQRFMGEGFTFVDSKDSLRQSVLHTNTERMQMVLPQTIDLPPILYNQSLKDYLSSLDNTQVYDTTQFDDETMLMPLVAVIEIRRPSVKIHITSQLKQFMAFMSSMLPYEYLAQQTDFLFTTLEGTLPVKAVDGKIPTQNHGYVPIIDAMTYGSLVPSVLGTRNLSKEPVWSEVFSTCINMLNSCRKKKSIFLDDIL